MGHTIMRLENMYAELVSITAVGAGKNSTEVTIFRFQDTVSIQTSFGTKKKDTQLNFSHTFKAKDNLNLNVSLDITMDGDYVGKPLEVENTSHSVHGIFLKRDTLYAAHYIHNINTIVKMVYKFSPSETEGHGAVFGSDEWNSFTQLGHELEEGDLKAWEDLLQDFRQRMLLVLL